MLVLAVILLLMRQKALPDPKQQEVELGIQVWLYKRTLFIHGTGQTNNEPNKQTNNKCEQCACAKVTYVCLEARAY